MFTTTINLFTNYKILTLLRIRHDYMSESVFFVKNKTLSNLVALSDTADKDNKHIYNVYLGVR